MLGLKQAQLESVRKPDSDLERQIAELADKVRAYEAKAKKPERPAGIMMLGKKRADGSIERIAAPSTEEVSAAE